MLGGLLKKHEPEQSVEPAREYIDRFEIVQKLGKGAQGIVYQAIDTKLNRHVAVKTLLHKNRDGTQIINEAKNVSNLEHSNIIPLYEIGTHNERPYLVYPYVKGKTLRNYLDTTEKVTILESTNIIAAVLDGLAHAHEKKIVHRDLNPSNILIDENNTPRIMDFGISTFSGHNTSDTGIVGTIQYMAPEQLNNDSVGPCSDVFAIGTVLFEMLTGHSPFKADNNMVSIYKIVNENVLPPSSRNKNVDAKLDQIVMKAMAKEKDKRYSSAIEMKEDLEHYMNKETEDKTDTQFDVDEQAAKEKATLLLLKRSIDKSQDFPVMGNSISNIMQLSNSTDCADKLAEIILRDQSLSSKILSMVNSSCYGQFGNEINTISRAVVILGLEQIQSISVSIMIFEKLNNGPMAETLKNNFCQSFLSAYFAKKLSQSISSLKSEEAFLASMFHNLGKQITIFFLPDEYNEILNLVIENGIEEGKACQRVLGLQFAHIGQYIANQWNLPENVIAGIQPKPRVITKKPETKSEYLAQVSAFTNEIIQIAACGNKEKAERELKLVMKRYKVTFNIDLEKLQGILNVLFDTLIAYCEVLGINPSVNTFCKNYISFVKNDFEFSDENLSEDSDAHAPKSETKNMVESMLTFGIARIAGLLFKKYDVAEILNLTVNALNRGLECEHAIVFLRDPVNGQMTAQAGAGKDISNVMKRFHFHCNDGPDIFNQSVKKQTDIFIPDVAHSSLIKLIPDWCKKTAHPKNLLIYPITSKQHCLGLVYVDNAKALSSKSSKAFDYINTLRKQLEVAVQQKP